MDTGLQRALMSIHYRERLPGKWTKPVGFALLTVSIERMEWASWFRSLSEGQGILCWDSGDIRTGTYEYFLYQLKHFECYRVKQVEHGESSMETPTPDWEIVLYAGPDRTNVDTTPAKE